MKKILVSGFEPFGGDSSNLSMDFLTYLNAKNNFSIHTVLLPVTFSSAFKNLEKEFQSIRPEILIMLGLAKTRTKISLEKVALNWIDCEIPDNEGRVVFASKINISAENAFFSSIPIENCLKNLDQNLFEISLTAGSFVCNYVYYEALRTINIPAIFIHLPGNSIYSNQEIFNSIFELIKVI